MTECITCTLWCGCFAVAESAAMEGFTPVNVSTKIVAALIAGLYPGLALAQVQPQTQPPQTKANADASAMASAADPSPGAVALATASSPPDPSSGGDATSTPGGTADTTTGTVALPTASPSPDSARFARLNALGTKGWDTPFPRIQDTLIADAGGVRSALADAGIGFLGFSLNSGVYNFRHDDTPGAVYNGRRPTYFVGSQALYLTFDTGKLGLQNGQIQGSVSVGTNGLNQINGPRFARISSLDYYQSLWGGKVEFKVGYFSLGPEFVGTSVGGSLVSGTLGPQAGIPVQAGFAFGGLTTPAADVRFNGKGGTYVKFGIARSIPTGGIIEVLNGDSTGLRFAYPDANVLTVGEVGIKQAAAPGVKSFWIRGGGIYNTTEFTNYKNGGQSQNWATYIGVDRQITQPDQEHPAHGLYVGASFNYAPPEQNLYSQYYEARAYGFGLIKGRGDDMASLVVSLNKLSDFALNAQYPGQRAANYAFTAIGSYSYKLIRGLYVQPGLGLVKNPIPAPVTPWGVNGYMTISIIL